MSDVFKVRFGIRFGIGGTAGSLLQLCGNGKEVSVSVSEERNVCAEIQWGLPIPYALMSGFLSNLEACRDHAYVILCM